MDTTELRQPTHREELERVLVSGASAQVAHEPDKAAAIAKGIKTVLDELAPVAPHPVAIAPLPALDHGRRVAPESINGGMPWSFTYAGHHISHENDTCYLIPTLEGTMKMGPGDMLITGVKGEIYPCKRDIFEATYGVALPVVDPGPDSLEREIQANSHHSGCKGERCMASAANGSDQ